MATTAWTKRMSCPNHEYTQLSVPTGISKENYIVFGCSEPGFEVVPAVKSIYKYDVDADSWQKLIDVPTHINMDNLSALDTKTSVLWLFNSAELIQIDLNQLKGKGKVNHINFDGIAIKSRYIGFQGNSIVIDGKFHLFGGSENGSILCWDKKFLEIASMPHGAKKLSRFGLTHNKSNCLAFGGYNYGAGKFQDFILEYNIKQKKWHKLAVSLPQAMWRCVCTKAIRDSYVLIFGGCDNRIIYNDILIYSLAHKTLRVSNIKCPTTTTIWGSATTVNDENKDEKIVFGYVRKDHYFPYYLLKLMQRFYLNEFVYLLGNKGKEHWRISTLDIV